MKNILSRLQLGKIATIVFITLLIGHIVLSSYAATTIGDIKNILETSKVDATGEHVITFTPTLTNVKHIRVEFHTTDGLMYTPPSTVTPPDISGAVLDFGSSSLWSDAGGIESNISTSIASNAITFSRTDGATYVLPASLRTLTISNVTNSSSVGEIYFTVSTYSTDGELIGNTPIETGSGAFSLTEGHTATGFVGTTFYFGIDDSNTSTKSNSADLAASSDPDERTAIHFGTLVAGAVPTENPTTGSGVDGHTVTVSTNSTKGYVISLEDEAEGLHLPGAVAGDRDSTDIDNAVINDFGEEDISGTVAGASESSFATAATAGEEIFTFKIDSGTAPSLTEDTYYSLKESSTSSAKIAEHTTFTSGAHTYTILFYATKHADTPGGNYTNTLTYTAVPAL